MQQQLDRAWGPGLPLGRTCSNAKGLGAAALAVDMQVGQKVGPLELTRKAVLWVSLGKICHNDVSVAPSQDSSQFRLSYAMIVIWQEEVKFRLLGLANPVSIRIGFLGGAWSRCFWKKNQRKSLRSSNSGPALNLKGLGFVPAGSGLQLWLGLEIQHCSLFLEKSPFFFIFMRIYFAA